jgi:hypothetical protein
MQQAGDRMDWRPRFLSVLQLFAQAGARLPLGVPDPVLGGGSALELYTGGLWAASDLEVVAADAPRLTAELFAVGFRWSDRPGHAARGLCHPELQIGITIVEAWAVPSAAEQSNRLVVTLGREPSRLAEVASLKVVGIEDLIAQQVGCWLRDGAPAGDLAAKVQALVELGREGVGGLFRAGYLQRRLARETKGEVVLEDLGSDEGREPLRALRTTDLAEMRARISTWRERHGLSSAPLMANGWDRPGTVLHGLVGHRPRELGRGGRSGLASAEIVPFDTVF